MTPPTTAQISKTVDCHSQILEEHTTRINEHEYLLNGVKDSHGLVKDVADMSDMMKTMTKMWVQQNVWNKIMGVLSVPILGGIIGLLWAIFTGEVSLVRP